MWDSDPKTWVGWLERYPDAIESQSQLPRKSDLVSLDSFVWSELDESLEKRKHLDASEYSRLVKWKLQRGKWRPRLQGFADALKEADVAAASKAAIEKLHGGNLKEALKPLVDLRGCGPATASAILAIADENVPFMSDELLGHTHGKDNKKYTVAVFLEMVDQATGKAEELTSQSKDRTWTARDVERAVFAAEHCTTTDPHKDVVKSAQEMKNERRAAKKDNKTPSQDHAEQKTKRTSQGPAVSRKRSRSSLVRADSDEHKSNAKNAAGESVNENIEVEQPDLDSKPKRSTSKKTAKQSSQKEKKTSPRKSKRRRGQ